MEKTQLLHVLKEIREKSPKRQFSQTVDLIFNLQGLDLKKPDQKVDFYINLPHNRGKKTRACALLDVTLANQAKGLFDQVISKEEFPKWAGKKKEQKKLAESCDYFVAQVDLMSQIAQTFGKVLGPKGKMPNPKAGCVFPTTIPNLQPIKDKLVNLARLQTKGELSIKVSVGMDTMSDTDITDNILAIYQTLLTKLPQEENNVKNVGVKFTMGPLFKIVTAKTTGQAKGKKQ